MEVITYPCKFRLISVSKIGPCRYRESWKDTLCQGWVARLAADRSIELSDRCHVGSVWTGSVGRWIITLQQLRWRRIPRTKSSVCWSLLMAASRRSSLSTVSKHTCFVARFDTVDPKLISKPRLNTRRLSWPSRYANTQELFLSVLSLS